MALNGVQFISVGAKQNYRVKDISISNGYFRY